MSAIGRILTCFMAICEYLKAIPQSAPSLWAYDMGYPENLFFLSELSLPNWFYLESIFYGPRVALERFLCIFSTVSIVAIKTLVFHF